METTKMQSEDVGTQFAEKTTSLKFVFCGEWRKVIFPIEELLVWETLIFWAKPLVM
jgi:hypothetical protein